MILCLSTVPVITECILWACYFAIFALNAFYGWGYVTCCTYMRKVKILLLKTSSKPFFEASPWSWESSFTLRALCSSVETLYYIILLMVSKDAWMKRGKWVLMSGYCLVNFTVFFHLFPPLVLFFWLGNIFTWFKTQEV